MTENPRNAESWAKPVSTLTVTEAPEGAPNLVEGKRLLSPIQGFGKMWQKTYKVPLRGIETTPEAVIAAWRDDFPSFWPKGNDFYPPLTGLEPGEVALIKAAGPGGMKFKTGVMVLYSDDVSFTLMTPEGHMFAGWITFSAHDEDGVTVAQTQVLMRAQDPLTELGLTLGGHRKEDAFWLSTLTGVASRFGSAAQPEAKVVCIDKRRQWRRAGNVRHNVGFRSGVHSVTSPLRNRGRSGE